LGKQVQLPYPSSKSVSQRPFDLVHLDVWGPAPFVCKGGHKYYIIFIDDFSHHTWIYFMKHRSEALSIYKNFFTMIHTYFDTSIRVFRADSTGEYHSNALCQVLTEQGTLAQFFCHDTHAQNGVAKHKHRHLIETVHALMIASSIPPHFWAETISIVTYLINIQPSSTLQEGITFEHLCGKTLDYSSLRLFGCVCYVLLAPRERAKLTAQFVECIFLGYNAEHKDYRCWDPVTRRMRTSRDVVFDKSHPFYPRPTTDASPTSLIDHLYFLLFHDAPPASLPIPHLILPFSVSSSEPPPVVPDYTVKPSMAQFYNHRGARLSDTPASSDELSSDVSSSSFIEDVTYSPPVEPSSPIDSSPKQLVRRNHRLHRPPDCYSPSAFITTVLSEPTSYHDAILHLEWQHTMAMEIATLERTAMWHLVPCPPRVSLITCKWVYKVKTQSNGSLERYKACLITRGFQQEKGHDYDETFAPVAHMTTIHTLLVVASVQEWSISQLDVKNVFLNGELYEDIYMHSPSGYSVPEGMVCHLRCSLYGLKQAPWAWFQHFASVVITASFFISAHDPALFVHMSPSGKTLLLLYVDNMIITDDDSEYIAFVKARLSDQFLILVL
jgi:hypothetical protein